MILCLASLVKDGNSEEYGTDEEWLELMDRGGLYHVKETTFSCFVPLKIRLGQFWKHLPSHAQLQNLI